MRRAILSILAAVTLAAGPAVAADPSAAEAPPPLPSYPWSFNGLFGRFNRPVPARLPRPASWPAPDRVLSAR